MTAPVRCWLVRNGRRVDPAGFVTRIDPRDHDKSRRWLQDQLRGAIRGDGANPDTVGGDYALDWARVDTPGGLVTTVRLP